MKILVVDDEAAARHELRFILTNLDPDLRIHEASDGASAIAHVDLERPDVVFLDIEMPEIDGLEVARILVEQPSPPLVVFATAYDQYAVDAFEVAAVDYVLKPFDEQRIARTLARIGGVLDRRDRVTDHLDGMRTFLASVAQPGTARVWGERSNRTRVPLDHRSIFWIVAELKQVFVHTATEKLRVNATLAELEETLGSFGFVRIHKAYIVNLDHVEEVIPWFSGGYQVRMKDHAHTTLPMSRRYARNVKRRGGW